MRLSRQLCIAFAFAALVHAQGTDGLISGRVTDRVSGKPVARATVSYVSGSTNTKGSQYSDAEGNYVLPLLPPGTYTLSAISGAYQRRQYEELVLPVAATLEVNFELRPLTDVFDSGVVRSLYLSESQRLLGFYGPDVDTSRAILVDRLRIGSGRLESSVSDVIDPVLVENLPFTGRNIYAALLLQPGVNADAATTRGLGLSVNGQRPSSSNFLLDGVENNNYLITGPLVTAAPEAIQEYRVSTNNFSAAYGGTSGYLANAVTRAGGSGWHGLGYLNLQNEILNANGFQRNFQGYRRAPFKETEPGFQVGGPIWRQNAFASAAFEYNRQRTRLDPQTFLLPTAATLTGSPISTGDKLLRRYRAIAAPDGATDTAVPVSLSAPSSLNYLLGTTRFDIQTTDARLRLMIRTNITRYDRPDYYWSPYPDFTSGFSERAQNYAASFVAMIGLQASNEVRAAWTGDLLRIGSNIFGLPDLTATGVNLPSATSPFAYRNDSRAWQFLDNFATGRGSHLYRFGGGVLARNIGGFIQNGAGGSYDFSSFSDFLSDRPDEFSAIVARPESPSSALSLPDYNRSYSNFQYSAFAQDTCKVGERLVLNYGLRYENFGSPQNIGAVKDDLVILGPGTTLSQKLTGAYFAKGQAGDQQLYSSDNNDWAGRFAFSWLLSRKRSILVRGSYGIFYDRPFDNLWQTVQNNSGVLATVLSPNLTALTDPGSSVLSVEHLVANPVSGQATLFQPSLRNPQIQSAFVGLQSAFSRALSFELNAIGSHSRGLLTTDIVNRDFSAPPPPNSSFRTRSNAGMPLLSYLGNQGYSNYDAVTALTRFRSHNVQGQVAYTWSHTIDNQSDPLAGDFNLEFSSASSSNVSGGRATFVQQFNSKADIGNADFDQRHSLVFYLTASSTSRRRLLSHWYFSPLGALRSGTPFTAYALSPSDTETATLNNNRANLLFPQLAVVNTPVPGGRQILNPSAFGPPAAGQIGSSGRNAFRGPYTFNTDMSVARTFPLPRFGKAARITVRADAYNFLNHANLRVAFFNPVLTSSSFGTAQYGTTGIQSAFPTQVPLTETARQVQMLLRFEF